MVFGPAILGSGTISILTTRSSERSFPWSVERNINAIEIGPLSKAESDIHLKTLGWNHPDLAYPSTGGIPGLNVAFAHDEINSAKSAVAEVLTNSNLNSREAQLLLPAISLLRGVDIFMLEEMATAAGLQIQSRSGLRRVFVRPVLEAGLIKESLYGFAPVKGLDVVLKTSWDEGHSEQEVAALGAAVKFIKAREAEGNWKGIEIDLQMAETALKNS